MTDEPRAKSRKKAGLAEAAAAPPHYLGHRARLRQRVIEGGAQALPDYELLELLLFGANPRADVKPLAKTLLERFGSLGALAAAEPRALAEVTGLGESGVALIKAVQELSRRLAREAVEDDRPVLTSWNKLLEYCRVRLAGEPVERFHLLFLDKRNRLIADEEQQRGTVDHTPVYPREIVKRALELNATALILVHNHPSGDPEPSQADIAMTREIVQAAAGVGILVHDHLVIGRSGHASFRTLGLL